MNSAELAARVAARTSMSKAGVDAAVNAVFSTIAVALASGETVTIVGFGTGSEPSQRNRDRRASAATRAPASPSPSPPQRRLPSRAARPFATPSASQIRNPTFRSRTLQPLTRK